MSLRDSLRMLSATAEHASKLRASIFWPGNRLSLLTHPQAAVAISGLRRNGLRDEVLVQIQLGQRRCLSSPVLPICKHRVPDDRCTAAFDAQPAKVEPTLTNSAQQFNAGDRDGAQGTLWMFDGERMWPPRPQVTPVSLQNS